MKITWRHRLSKFLSDLFWMNESPVPWYQKEYVDRTITSIARMLHWDWDDQNPNRWVESIIELSNVRDARKYAIRQIIARIPEKVPVMLQALEEYPIDKQYAEQLLLLL